MHEQALARQQPLVPCGGNRVGPTFSGDPLSADLPLGKKDRQTFPNFKTISLQPTSTQSKKIRPGGHDRAREPTTTLALTAPHRTALPNAAPPSTARPVSERESKCAAIVSLGPVG